MDIFTFIYFFMNSAALNVDVQVLGGYMFSFPWSVYVCVERVAYHWQLFIRKNLLDGLNYILGTTIKTQKKKFFFTKSNGIS